MIQEDPTVKKIVQKVLKEVPRDLLELFYSEELPEKIASICSNCGIEDEKILQNIGAQIGKILFGKLSPEKFLDTLKTEVKLPSITAIKVFQEIDEQIFSSVRESLNKLYKKESPANKTPEEKIEEPVAKEELKEKKESPAPKEADTYQEPIE